MQTYSWKGIDQHGNKHHGITAAESVEHLRAQLLLQEIALLSCKTKRQKFALRHVAAFFNDLSLVLSSGIPLLQALQFTKSISPLPTITALITQVERGSSFSEALKTQSFSPLVVHIIQSGEKSGDLAKVCGHLARQLNQRILLTQKLKQAAMLPLITFGFALCIVLSLFIFVIPQLEELFNSMNQPMTRFDVSTFIYLLALGACGLALLIKYTRTLNIPIIGPLLALTNVIHVTQSLALLLKTGTALHPAVIFASNACSNKHLAQQFQDIATHLNHGLSFTDAVLAIQSPYIPEIFISSIQLGEQTGKLDTMLEKTGELMEKRLLDRINFLSTLFQPLLLLGVGLFIAFLLLSLYLPIFNAANLA